MKHLYYIRHGLSEANKANKWSGSTDTPLTPEGHEQAKIVGAKAKNQGLVFDIIISSPLQRAVHTANHVALATGYDQSKIVLLPELSERHFGILENTHSPEAVKLYTQGEYMIDGIEGVERLVDFQWRAQQVLDYLRSLPYETVLVVGHGAFARTLLRSINGQPITVYVEPLPNAEIVKVL